MEYKGALNYALLIICLIHQYTNEVESVKLSDLLENDLETKIKNIDGKYRNDAQLLRKAMIEANPKLSDTSFLLDPSIDSLARGVAHYLELKSDGRAAMQAASEQGSEDFRSMIFSISILNICREVVPKLEGVMKDVQSPKPSSLDSEWLETTRMCQRILAEQETLREESLRALIRLSWY